MVGQLEKGTTIKILGYDVTYGRFYKLFCCENTHIYQCIPNQLSKETFVNAIGRDTVTGRQSMTLNDMELGSA